MTEFHTAFEGKSSTCGRANHLRWGQLPSACPRKKKGAGLDGLSLTGLWGSVLPTHSLKNANGWGTGHLRWGQPPSACPRKKKGAGWLVCC
ncbi:MAG: hypothetical protein ABSD72_06350 [Terracidiphilus sp.]|jgi:hypothetical protein